MDPAFALLIIFVVYSVLLGVCLARMRSIGKEIDEVKQVIATLGTLQRDVPIPSALQGVSPELIRAIETLAGKTDE